MTYTNTWDESTPVGTEDASTTDDYLRQHRLDLGERLSDILYGFDASDGSGAESRTGVKNVPLYKQSDNPTVRQNYGHLYVKIVSGVPELFFQNDESAVFQITSGDNLGSVSTELLAKGITVNSGNVNKTASFQSEDSSAIVELYDNGTTGGQEAILKRIADVLTLSPDNGDNRLATSTANATDTARQIADKGYVDNKITANTTMVPAITGAGTGYGGEQSVTLANGLIMKFGKMTLTSNETEGVTFDDAFNATTPLIPTISFTDDAGTSDQVFVSALSKTALSLRHIGTGTLTAYWSVMGR